MEACKQRYKTKYVRLPELLLELDIARSEGNYKKVLAKYARPFLLIIDEWLLLKPTESEQHDILEPLHQRRKNLLQSFVHSMNLLAGMTSLAEMKALLPKQFWTGLSITLTKLILLLPTQPNIVL